MLREPGVSGKKNNARVDMPAPIGGATQELPVLTTKRQPKLFKHFNCCGATPMTCQVAGHSSTLLQST